MRDFLTRPVADMFRRYGEDFTLDRAGSLTPRRGLMVPMSNSDTAVYFDANESVGLIKPALSLYLPGTEDAPLEGDIFTRAGRLWTVRKTWPFVVNNVVVVYLALCD